jgi:sugar phosphate isomerase/epimerase
MLATVPLCVSLAGIAPESVGAPDGPRGLIDWAARSGVRGVRLDGRFKGLRARELERSGRRDLASLLRRLELRFSGIDLWIPAEHFADPIHAGRAIEAVIEAIGLCSDLATLGLSVAGRSVSIMLPKGADEAARAIAEAAERAGVRLADHGEGAEPRATPGGAMGVGLDAAALLMRSIDPVAEVSRMAGASGSRLVSARATDTDGIGRVAVGDGRLDVAAYAAALAVTRGGRVDAGDVVLDLRGVRSPAEALERGMAAWSATGIGSV